MIIKLRWCRRCKGDLFREYDILAGSYDFCLQCGAIYYSEAIEKQFGIFHTEQTLRRRRNGKKKKIPVANSKR